MNRNHKHIHTRKETSYKECLSSINSHFIFKFSVPHDLDLRDVLRTYIYSPSGHHDLHLPSTQKLH